MLPSGVLSYGYHTMGVLRWVPTVLVLLPWLFAPLAPSNDARIRDLAGPSSFRLLDWETANLAARANRLLAGLVGSPTPAPASDDAATLRAYFAEPAARRGPLRPGAEAALERLVGASYTDSGLRQAQPLPLPALIPPLLVALEAPPNVLVIAPRNELRVIGSQVMRATDPAAQERLEQSADSTGVSALIAPIGGLATYPSMVLDEDSPERVLGSVAHEWLHQYLIFYPLGTGYWRSQQTREINETAADLVGQEVGGRVARQVGVSGASAVRSGAPPAGAFDFRAFMRATRQETERLLAAGQIEPAEAYMRARRDELAARGYAIRKLNQAYFALYGSYGDGFAASPANPIPGLLRTLRERSASLGDFVVRVRTLTTVGELRAAAES